MDESKEKIKDKNSLFKNKTEKSFLFGFKEILFFVFDIGKTLFFVIAVAFIIRFYLIQPFYVEGQSMEPNFNNGEYLLIDEFSYHFREPQRGEVIVFHPPNAPYQNYIKRIIGLPGEEVDFNEKEDGGFVIKNEKYPEGKELEEDYLFPGTTTRGEKDIKIEENNFFVLGDNRTASSDSRIFGQIFRKNITGRVWLYIKMEPWLKKELFGLKLSIPKISNIGKLEKPNYKIDL